MNAYLLQLMNKLKYPFSKSKNIAHRRKEQAKGNLTKKESSDEIKLIMIMAVVVIAAFIICYILYATLLF